MSKKGLIVRCILILLFPVSFILGKIASLSPEKVERVYSRGIYRVFSQAQNTISGRIPFSLHELLEVLVIVVVIIMLLLALIQAFKLKRKWYKPLINFLLTVLAGGSLLYFIFTINWGLNNYRLTFGEIANLEVRDSSVEELKELCRSLINRTNTFREMMDEDSNGITTTTMSDMEILNAALEGYQNAAKIYPELGGRYAAPKAVILSVSMTYLDTWGLYSAFTGEANVNVNIPVYFIPHTASHEMAHQRGFSREDEANYIGYFACMMNPNPLFQYSGSLEATISAMNALYSASFEDWKELRDLYSEGVIRDLKYLNEFNAKYEGFVGRISSSANDIYLKANNQPNGIESYGRMVDLLLAEYRNGLEK